MIEHLMTDQRSRVITGLIALVSITLLLWFVRGPRPVWPNIVFFAVAMLLAPLAYLGIYAILYLNVRVNHVSNRSLRWTCGFFFLGAVTFLAGSAVFAVYQFATHRPMPPPNLLALGAALGAMRGWGLQATTAVPK
jgi:hypothetical protein